MHIIDAHNHPDFGGMDFKKIIANMDENGIAKTCLLSWESPTVDNRGSDLTATPSPIDDSVAISFERCLAYYEKAPDRFILGYAPDPRKPGAIQKMKAAISIYGVRWCGEVKFRMMYDNPDAIDLFRFSGENGLPVTLHMDYPVPNKSGVAYPRAHYWYGGSINTLENVLQQCPDTKFLGHAPGFWAHISNDDLGLTQSYPKGPVIPGGKIEEFLDKYPNLYCDCSAHSCLWALQRDVEYTKKLILQYPDRFLFARDMFDSDTMTFFDSLELPEEVCEKFYHKNFEALIGG